MERKRERKRDIKREREKGEKARKMDIVKNGVRGRETRALSDAQFTEPHVPRLSPEINIPPVARRSPIFARSKRDPYNGLLEIGESGAKLRDKKRER